MELMIVVVIIGILAAVALPNIGGAASKRQLNSSARNIASLLQQARSEAVSRNKDVYLEFTPATDSYMMFTDTSTLVPSSQLSKTVSITGTTFPSHQAVFNSRGFAMNSGKISLQVEGKPNDANWSRTISVTLGGSTRIN